MPQIGPVFAQMFPPKPKWGVEQIPDLSGKVTIVTGACGNTGVGKETVRALLNHGAKVYIATRNVEKSHTAIADLKKDTGKEAQFIQLDLSDLLSVKKAAEEYLSKESKLHILFNNAGVMTPPKEELTKQGYDMQAGTNALGHFYFTQLLLPALQAVHAESPNEKARVVFTSSSGAYVTDFHIDWFDEGPARLKQSTDILYAHSKLANAVQAIEFSRRYADTIVTTAVNPGNLRTELQRNTPRVQKAVYNLVMYPPPFGALTQLFAGTMPEAAKMNGEFLIPWARIGKWPKAAVDPENGKKLWAWMEEHTKNI
ncbi:NAD-P-binding protein [Vararia minispora EC-137]|uniref:NAD-P-binding protein n=1 Tax=Vararia minispora EC-137 TaxID=1314806 RepID=A0ACB8QHL5_9AGAM|nr:NAD-P-binding protein [Vararia minispora EC-137]